MADNPIVCVWCGHKNTPGRDNCSECGSVLAWRYSKPSHSGHSKPSHSGHSKPSHIGLADVGLGFVTFIVTWPVSFLLIAAIASHFNDCREAIPACVPAGLGIAFMSVIGGFAIAVVAALFVTFRNRM
jgi:hypothetical protein